MCHVVPNGPARGPIFCPFWGHFHRPERDNFTVPPDMTRGMAEPPAVYGLARPCTERHRAAPVTAPRPYTDPLLGVVQVTSPCERCWFFCRDSLRSSHQLQHSFASANSRSPIVSTPRWALSDGIGIPAELATRSRDLVEAFLDLALRQPLAVYHDTGASCDVGHILQRVSVDENEVGPLADGDGPGGLCRS